jgi:hypothetical protein
MPLKRFQAKWRPVRIKKTPQIKSLDPRFDCIETGIESQQLQGLGRGAANQRSKAAGRGIRSLAIEAYQGGTSRGLNRWPFEDRLSGS